MDQDRKTYAFEESDLVGLVRDSVALMKPLADERGITLSIQTEEEELFPVMDALAMQQVLINLLDNALKFSPSDTRVTVSLKRSTEAQHCEISVADQGRGIALADRRRIFERFCRVGSELQRETQGAGVGLSIVKHIVDAHRGAITLDSEVGRGSTFTIHVPLWRTSW